ncbi:hypothetical protein BKK52_01045 [Rodentibacter trehalosifermentans]|uniref:Uncharacterized protein n=1 Tax=Rodentibacter trehalosifermentans TaxID=1908263 RepID=A0A1V3J693_9PAST|nr:hypothetical protein [Rodentibacter trehalosifermentans]OOF50765.1 hypothetical protein BKK52_01045 [Rodentibacter trehalosifermentans]
MANVKMTFMVEVDGETVIRHQVEEEITKKGFYFSQERQLTKEIINKMNEFHFERWVELQAWSTVGTDHDKP